VVKDTYSHGNYLKTNILKWPVLRGVLGFATTSRTGQAVFANPPLSESPAARIGHLNKESANNSIICAVLSACSRRQVGSNPSPPVPVSISSSHATAFRGVRHILYTDGTVRRSQLERASAPSVVCSFTSDFPQESLLEVSQTPCSNFVPVLLSCL